MLCDDCSKKHICTTLCPEAELYTSQDNEEWHDEGEDTYICEERLMIFNPKTGAEKPLISTMERAVLCRLGSGMSKKEISKELRISINYTGNLCRRLRAKSTRLFR